jgi:Flp pilus assembly pilin Flp
VNFACRAIGTTFKKAYLLKFSTVSSTRNNFVMLKAVRAGAASRLQLLVRSRVLRRLLRCEDGVAAVEFALVAAPFLALMFAIIETALVFFTGQYFETVVADSSRLIMTGQVQTQGLTQTQFINQICGKVVALFNAAR